MIYKYVYLNNLMNICFICYFLYVKLKRKIYFSHLRCILSPDLIQIWCTNKAWMWFCDIFSWKWVTHQVIPEKHMFNWWTVSLCHFRGKRCYFNIPIQNSTKYCTFQVGLLFVGLFNKLFMTKCEQVLWLELKPILKCHKWRPQFFFLISFFCYFSLVLTVNL